METSSAAEKVFAIPELLEQVLLCLSCRQLFVLLRINTTFHNTISDSVSLRRLMNLEYEKSDDEEDIDCLDSPYDDDVDDDVDDVSDLHPRLDIGPFNAVNEKYWVPCLERLAEHNQRPIKHPSSDDLTVYTFSLRLPVSESDKKRQMGMRVRRKRRLRICETGSWWKMKLTDQAIPARIVIRVGEEYDKIFYVDALELAAGEGNLGMLVYALDRIRNRSDEEHKRCESRFNELFLVRD